MFNNYNAHQQATPKIIQEPRTIQCIDCGLIFNYQSVEKKEIETKVEGYGIIKEVLVKCPRCGEFVRYRQIKHN